MFILLLVVGLLLLTENVLSQDNFFMDEGANKAYHEGSVIDRIENLTHFQCAHQCRRMDNCKHTSFHGGTCILLRAGNITSSGNGAKIYSHLHIKKPGQLPFKLV